MIVLLERVMGIEPTLLAWKAKVLPLNYSRAALTPSIRTNHCHSQNQLQRMNSPCPP